MSASRGAAGDKTPAQSFLIATASIVAFGCAVTIVPLLEQWKASYGKPHPLIFGEFGEGAVQFTLSLGYLTIALVSIESRLRQKVIICAALFVPAMILAASFVRFTFVAICAVLLLAA